MQFSKRTLLLALALSLGFVPAALAYKVHFKNGSVIDARAKYQVRDGQAVITLPNGTVTAVPLNQVDVAKTEAANRVNYGSATVINTPNEAPPPPPEATAPQGSLGRLITRQGTPPPAAPTRRTREEPAVAAAPGRGARTAAGHVDLGQLDAKPHPNYELSSAVQELFRARGASQLQVQTGTRADRVLLEISTNSEGSVFQALETSAGALLAMRERFPGKIAAFEILMVTPAGERAGQFLLTPDLADALASKKVETSAFFVDNVQF
jgi:hypothetical protein